MQVRDPICGMTIEAKDAAGTSTYKDKTYYFCSNSCKQKFEKSPVSYVSEKMEDEDEAEAGSVV